MGQHAPHPRWHADWARPCRYLHRGTACRRHIWPAQKWAHPRPHLHRDRAHALPNICTGTWASCHYPGGSAHPRTLQVSGMGLDAPRPHTPRRIGPHTRDPHTCAIQRTPGGDRRVANWRPSKRDWAPPSHICTVTGLTPPTSAPGLGSPPTVSALGLIASGPYAQPAVAPIPVQMWQG